ncbi:hypothetical protein HUB98_01130 [Paenibacillus barcinonensis]|uniref:Uncharacterized protein n=1 Tax=Paenibacillus barcinonensis TaxID=198119 RepID=A0A2V4VU93_PAEBA|nr:hypothetical protein [Paenibacillus barcinonensis]PYE50380.1 hypothetical protein DFQ00_104339 [Paenibacillus barcinonensis]QKS55051.1 hypothetical protein HUB98_01130 [Paenibacillus barcinonensis]
MITLHRIRTFFAPVQTEMPAELKDYSGLYGNVGATMEINIQNGIVKVSFVKERNAKTYVKVQGYLSLPGLGQMGMSTYDYQKLEHNKLDAVTQEKGSARNGLQYFALDEKIPSLFYLVPSQLIKSFKVRCCSSPSQLVNRQPGFRRTNLSFLVVTSVMSSRFI